MNSLATQNSLIPLLCRNAGQVLVAVALGAPIATALAHDDAAAVPPVPALQLGVSLALADVHALQALPSQRLEGYLLQGDAGVDRRASRWEHGVLAAGWRLHPQWAAYAAVGQHDADTTHVEAAWVRYDLASAHGGLGVNVQLGRAQPQLGSVMTKAGHLERFSLMPLAKRLAFDGDRQDEGIQMGAQHQGSDWTGTLNAGLWRGQLFPGSQGARPAPSLHLGVARGRWQGDFFAMAFQPDGRGALVQGDSGVHTHNAPDCSSLVAGVVCFAGRTRVMGSSVQWDDHDWNVTVQGAYWLRNDQGTLRSVNGVAAHSAHYRGGWVQTAWQPHADWELGWRSERISARLALDGAGASWLAQEARLSVTAPVRRDTILLRWRALPYASISAQFGREVHNSHTVNFSVLRLVLQGDLRVKADVPQ